MVLKLFFLLGIVVRVVSIVVWVAVLSGLTISIIGVSAMLGDSFWPALLTFYGVAIVGLLIIHWVERDVDATKKRKVTEDDQPEYPEAPPRRIWGKAIGRHSDQQFQEERETPKA